jgi:DNA-directed RNA polymerase omega subunit
MENENIPLEKLLPATGGSIYKLAILVAKRALALADGEKSLVDRPNEKALHNALREIAEGKVKGKE